MPRYRCVPCRRIWRHDIRAAAPSKGKLSRDAIMMAEKDTSTEVAFLTQAKEIARWHHERWDGKGYPDGLKGDDIPISAQLVSMADVYDALTSERCYKKAFPHETAVQMITNGECGAFNPLLIQCLLDVQGELKQEILQW